MRTPEPRRGDDRGTTLVDRPRERGASSVEYGLLVAAIAAIIVAAVFTLGGSVKNTFTDVNSRIIHSGTTVPAAPVVPPAGP